MTCTCQTKFAAVDRFNKRNARIRWWIGTAGSSIVAFCVPVIAAGVWRDDSFMVLLAMALICSSVLAPLAIDRILIWKDRSSPPMLRGLHDIVLQDSANGDHDHQNRSDQKHHSADTVQQEAE